LSRNFKFIHTADTHLGANWPAIAAKDRVQIPAFGEAFGQVVDCALREGVDFIVHGGDLLDHPRPSVAAASRMLDELKKLRMEGIPFIITKGSHDASLGFFERMGGNWLYLLDEKLGLVNYVDIDAKPSVDVRTDDASVVRIYGLGDYGIKQEEMLDRLILKMRREGSDYSILVMHGSIQEMPQVKGASISLSKMAPLIGSGLVDYLALGHNHRHWEDERVQVMNPGSTEFTSFGEAAKSRYAYANGELRDLGGQESPKGFYVVRVEGEITTPDFRTLQTRDVRDVIVEFAGATPQEVVEGLVLALQKHSHPRAILRPIATGYLAGQHQATDIKVADVVQGVKDALYVAYPLPLFGGRAEPLVRYGPGMSYQAVLEQALSARYGRASKDVARLADSIVESYRTLGNKASAKVIQQIEAFDTSCLGEGRKDAEKA
jgi:DNA repair exonuclease SbcCD nuclease subunit